MTLVQRVLAATTMILTQIQILAVPMIVKPFVIMSTRHASMHVLVAMGKMGVALEPGAAENRIQSC